MNHEDENLLRHALEREALRHQPSAWAANATAVRDRSVRRRRRVRATVAVALAACASAAVAAGAALAGSPGSALTRGEVAAPGPAPVSSAPERPAVRIVPADQDLALGHDIWMKLSDRQSCVALGPFATRAYDCSSVTNANQPQGTLSLRVNADPSGTLYTPLYVGPGNASTMTVQVDATLYRATVVKLAGRPGYATGYLWLPARSQAMGASELTITVRDAQGDLLASTTPTGS
ncbi:hypothetical protein [Streptacidiphilus melanogenes]|uniref:hypothetical protein n=1 Tax=Streptacidiphilus melanogenes TaxID=411235 RepID=UPI0006950B68|nr:hypothetical protein [Streptacidiphilus melanogenes]